MAQTKMITSVPQAVQNYGTLFVDLLSGAFTYRATLEQLHLSVLTTGCSYQQSICITAAYGASLLDA